MSTGEGGGGFPHQTVREILWGTKELRIGLSQVFPSNKVLNSIHIEMSFFLMQTPIGLKISLANETNSKFLT